MPAKDIYHDTVKRALIKDGWKITAENLHLPWGGTNLYVDLGAEKVFIAEKKGQKIAVEVKSFSGRSEMVELEKSLGQFFLYRFALRRDYPDRELFLAIRRDVYERIFLTPDGVGLIETENLKIIVFDEIKEELVRWIS
ncbi:MAG: XisH family protein [Acidobacteriota bacterium]|nr:XisH family protein [Acidobacteriota bacterium]